MQRRQLLVGIGLIAVAAGPSAAAAAKPLVTIHKSPSCGCCLRWVAHLEANGFDVKVVKADDLAAIRAKAGVPDDLAACHTAFTGAYFVEGHVPAADVHRLLRERPAGAKGIAVAGMPTGSPGMESPSGRKTPYDTVLVTAKGRKVFVRHA